MMNTEKNLFFVVTISKGRNIPDALWIKTATRDVRYPLIGFLFPINPIETRNTVEARICLYVLCIPITYGKKSKTAKNK